MPIPKEPIIFNKAPSCICGPNDDTMIPKDSTKLDWEVELGIVIGSRARYLSKNNALDVVAGYFLANDVSERVFQIERAGQWTKGKGCETFGPIGPWLVTKDEIKDPQKLDMWLDVNGEKRQRGNTSNDDLRLPAHRLGLLAIFRPRAGRLIITGTPPGVGLGMKPEPKFLKAGDVVTLGIDRARRAAAEGREVQGLRSCTPSLTPAERTSGDNPGARSAQSSSAALARRGEHGVDRLRAAPDHGDAVAGLDAGRFFGAGDRIAVAPVDLHDEERAVGRASISSIVSSVSAPCSGATTTSMTSPRLRKLLSSSRMRSDSRMKREVSGNSSISAIRSAPIWVGSTTLLAPACISLRSVEHRIAAGDDLDLRVEAARAERDEHVGGVVGQHAGQRAGAHDAGIQQRRLARGVALQADMAGIARLRHAALVLLDHDIRAPGRPSAPWQARRRCGHSRRR